MPAHGDMKMKDMKMKPKKEMKPKKVMKPNTRGQMVSKLMKEQGLTLGQASKMIKDKKMM